MMSFVETLARSKVKMVFFFSSTRRHTRYIGDWSSDVCSSDLVQGTLDMLILRILLFGPAHGHRIAKHIQRTTEDVLQVEHGSLYPALHRLERKGWVSSKWELAKDRNREFKYYRLTPAGKKQLVVEESKWRKLTGAVGRIMWPAEEV